MGVVEVLACSDDLRSREPAFVHLGALQWYFLMVSTRLVRTSSSMESLLSWEREKQRVKPGISQSLKTRERWKARREDLLAVVNLAIVVLDELLDEALVLVQHLLPHVRDVMKHSFILHQEVFLAMKEGEGEREGSKRVEIKHWTAEVCTYLCARPCVVARHWRDGREQRERDPVVDSLPCLVHEPYVDLPWEFHIGT